MVYSMTGYGKANEVINGKDITVEVKSVNHRYFEYSSRIPRFLNFLDDKIKKDVSQEISRGKIEVSLNVRYIDKADTSIQIDDLLAQSYYNELLKLANILKIENNISIMDIAKYEGVVVQTKNADDADILWQDVQVVLQNAIQEFKQMRSNEGLKLKEDIIGRLLFIQEQIIIIEQISPDRADKYREKLYNKLQKILQDRQIDDARILTEAAIFADKAAIDEEITRLNSHIGQFVQILNSSTSQGRKLDFLTQELNRETNTIGSKANDIEITQIVIEIKAEIEKIREQIQNIE